MAKFGLTCFLIFAFFDASLAFCIQRSTFGCAHYCIKTFHAQVYFTCCDTVEKYGSCPSSDVATYEHDLNLSNLHCCTDFDCPDAYKCCPEKNYGEPYYLCKLPILPGENLPNDIDLPPASRTPTVNDSDGNTSDAETTETTTEDSGWTTEFSSSSSKRTKMPERTEGPDMTTFYPDENLTTETSEESGSGWMNNPNINDGKEDFSSEINDLNSFEFEGDDKEDDQLSEENPTTDSDINIDGDDNNHTETTDNPNVSTFDDYNEGGLEGGDQHQDELLPIGSGMKFDDEVFYEDDDDASEGSGDENSTTQQIIVQIGNGTESSPSQLPEPEWLPPASRNRSQ